MEYLTLQDLPHRHFHSLHSRSMAADEHHQKAGGLPSLAAQNHHMRNSPPFQPGEQRPSQNALPSFSQLLQNVREPSPPRTPSRRKESMESSPVDAQPQFEDVAWQDGKRRRIDTVTDIHHPSNVSGYPPYDVRRTGSALIDPALPSSASSPPRGSLSTSASMHPTAPNHHHRPSLPYPAPPPNPASHARHQSSPVPHGHVAYHPHPAPNMVHPGPYSHAPQHRGPPYDHRPSYFQEAHAAPQAHSYDRVPHHDPYYSRAGYPTAPHPGYENSYHPQAQPYNYTFQSTMGPDNNSFNRKRRGNLPKEATGILKAWFSAHRDSPYPTEDEKMTLCGQTGLTLNQVSNWFINARRRAPQKEQRDARENTNEEL